MTVEQPKLWSQHQAVRAAEIWQSHFVDIYGDDLKLAPKGAGDRVFRRIVAAIGRDFNSVYNRFNLCGASFGANQRSARSVSTQQMQDLLARKDAESRAGLTGIIFGDPPPGFSALDKRKSACGAGTGLGSGTGRR